MLNSFPLILGACIVFAAAGSLILAAVLQRWRINAEIQETRIRLGEDRRLSLSSMASNINLVLSAPYDGEGSLGNPKKVTELRSLAVKLRDWFVTDKFYLDQNDRRAIAGELLALEFESTELARSTAILAEYANDPVFVEEIRTAATVFADSVEGRCRDIAERVTAAAAKY